ncbi:SusD-like starch-binding protein associating with outer membrane [Mangrovibacterium diazotrophicum]|uniref:SusD-like starch-binding protein associating with outer membrane n=2 Tax=Mangrovibacterium diazotrophicum TaxID=1261403 RepID=A0A419VXI6_9BACT|nr:SusD-like starch-binding protein associating with outer membrane [Mangrovibacterium diazotrophicum]
MVSFTSCDDFLTVEPKDMVSVDKALSSRDGYVAALVGVYEKMRTSYSPSSFLFCSGTDELANIYAFPSYSAFPSLNSCYNHDYDDTNFDDASGSAFLSMYELLVNINVIIEHLETSDVLSDEEFALIEGEAKGLRALIQFDLWRLYGPVPGEDMSDLVLPYALTASKDPLSYSTYPEYFTLLLADLNDARADLAVSDPILKYSNDELSESGSIDGYNDLNWYYRQNRMNYYAVTGLLARVEQWMGNKDQAVTYAKEVIAAKNEDGSSKFSLGTTSNIGDGDYAFSTEHLFGVKITEYDDEDYNSYNAAAVGDSYYLEGTSWDGTVRAFENYTTDIRYVGLMGTLSSNAMVYNAKVTKKYSNMSEEDSGEKSIPVIRLAEMYLIVVEADSDLGEAQTYYEKLLNTRNDDIKTITEDNQADIAFAQYVKELWAEGQIFYACKRQNRSTLPVSGASISTADYRVKLPSGETNADL